MYTQQLGAQRCMHHAVGSADKIGGHGLRAWRASADMHMLRCCWRSQRPAAHARHQGCRRHAEMRIAPSSGDAPPRGRAFLADPGMQQRAPRRTQRRHSALAHAEPDGHRLPFLDALQPLRSCYRMDARRRDELLLLPLLPPEDEHAGSASQRRAWCQQAFDVGSNCTSAAHLWPAACSPGRPTVL